MRELKRKTEENPRTRRANATIFNSDLLGAIITIFMIFLVLFKELKSGSVEHSNVELVGAVF